MAQICHSGYFRGVRSITLLFVSISLYYYITISLFIYLFIYGRTQSVGGISAYTVITTIAMQRRGVHKEYSDYVIVSVLYWCIILVYTHLYILTCI